MQAPWGAWSGFSCVLASGCRAQHGVVQEELTCGSLIDTRSLPHPAFGHGRGCDASAADSLRESARA